MSLRVQTQLDPTELKYYRGTDTTNTRGGCRTGLSPPPEGLTIYLWERRIFSPVCGLLMPTALRLWLLRHREMPFDNLRKRDLITPCQLVQDIVSVS